MTASETGTKSEEFNPDDPKHTRFDLVREGARRDGVEIVHYEPRFTTPGTKEEKRVVRFIAFCFAVVGLSAVFFIVAYVAWPWQYKSGWNVNKWYTPVLGITLGMTFLFIGIAIITWAKKLMPEEVSVETRHDGASDPTERKLTAATALSMVDELGIKRRPLLKGAVALGLAPVGVAAIMPLGGLIKDHKSDLIHTAWKKGVRLMREDQTLVRPEDVSAGGQITVFPAIPDGNSNTYADSPTLLIHLREDDAQTARHNALRINRGSQWNSFVAYSKICTHAGCPASLYEEQTNRMLCPCHQSQFNIINNAQPVFGPATRPLPQLPITVDSEGYFVALSDYKVPVGPGFWERS